MDRMVHRDIETMVSILAIAMGGIASLYPALKASKMDPYEAIRVGQS